MNRIHQLSPEEAGGKTAQLYSAIESRLGFVPNLMRVLGNSPAALEGYLSLSAAIARGVLPARVREQIALAVAEINGCGYCLSAHAFLGAREGLSLRDIAAARQAESTNDETEGILQLARSITIQHGQLSDEDIAIARQVGLNDGQIVEVVLNVVENILTNYVNNVALTVIDFPEIERTGASARVGG